LKNIRKLKDSSMYEIHLTGEQIKDIANCIEYHNMQHERMYRGYGSLDMRVPSMYKSMTHYKRLLKDLDGRVDEI
jgi:hypothetical protein